MGAGLITQPELSKMSVIFLSLSLGQRVFMLQLDMNKLSLRPIQETDKDFLLYLYTLMKEPELSFISNLSVEQKQQLIQQQFDAQHMSYTQNYADARLDLLLLEDKAIGRFYVQRTTENIQIMDIILLKEMQNQGIGSYLVKQLITEAQETKRTLSLYVETFNPAIRLYERLGFVPIEASYSHYYMRWMS